MNEIFNKIPKPVLVILILIAAVIFFVLNDPPKDECEMQAQVFDRSIKGLIKGTKIKKKTQFPLIEAMKDKCKQGNSVGACHEYFNALAKVINESQLMSDRCVVKYNIDFPQFKTQLAQGLQIFSLAAWGDKPPENLSDRMGWLNEGHLRTFCRMKKKISLLVEDEEFETIKNTIFREYPDRWEKSEDASFTEIERASEDRPRALKTASNPKGRLTLKEVYEKSLFSLPCQMLQ